MTILTLTVKPNAKESAWVNKTLPHLALRLKARPQEGEANTELCQFLATFFGIPKTSITILSGETSRQKRLNIPLSPDQIIHILSKT